MARGGIEQDETPIGELVDRLIDESKGYAHAELGLAKAKAGAKVDALKVPALLLAGAFLFLQAGVVVLCVTIGLALATLIGPTLGFLVATVIALAIAGALGVAAKRLLDGAI